MTEIFQTTITALQVGKWIYDTYEAAREAKDTIKDLNVAIEDATLRLTETQRVLQSLSPNEDIDSIVARTYGQIPSILREYEKIGDQLQNLRFDSEDNTRWSSSLKRGWKRAKWLKREPKIHACIERLRDQDARLDKALHILNTFQAGNNSQTQQLILSQLDQIDKGLDQSHFSLILDRLSDRTRASSLDYQRTIAANPPLWVLYEESLRAWYQNPTDSGNPWLWIFGGPGVGKSHLLTFLASYMPELVLDDGLSRDQVSGEVKNETLIIKKTPAKPPLIGIAIYYCRFDEESRQGPEDILRDILRQLLYCLWEIAPRKADKHAKKIEEMIQSTGTLAERSSQPILQEVSHSFDQVYIAVDGLDEMPNTDCSRLLAVLQKLRSPTIKIMVTSRDGFRSTTIFNSSMHIDAAKNDTTIRAFVQGTLSKYIDGGNSDSDMDLSTLVQGITSDEKRNEFTERIIEVADSNFLCANLLLRQFSGISAEDLDYSMKNLAGDFSQLLEFMMDRINRGDDGRIGKRALLWLIYSRSSSLSLEQLQHAVLFSLYSDNTRSHEVTPSRLSKATSYLLHPKAGPKTMISIHKAIKDFCVQPGRAESYFEEHPHSIIAKTCLGCMARYDDETGTMSLWENALAVSPFLDYASANWGWHMSLAGESLPQQPFPNLDLMSHLKENTFLDSATVAIQGQLQQLGIWKPQMWKKLESLDPPVSALHILAFFDLPKTARTWIEMGNPVRGFDNPSDDQTDCTPLYVASVLGNVETVKELKRKGADPAGPNGPGGMNAFEAAVKAGHYAVVAAILQDIPLEKKQKMVSTKGKGGHYQLVNACGSITYPGNPEMVRRILQVIRTMPEPMQRRILLNRGGPKLGTALHRAAEANAPEIISQLLEFPGGEELLEIRNKYGDTALMNAAWASHTGSTKALEHLLELGADPLKQNDEGNTAAHLAALNREHSSMASSSALKLLLEKSNLMIQNNKGETPLHIICEQGRPKHLAAIESYLDIHRDQLFVKVADGRTPISLAASLPTQARESSSREMQGKIVLINLLIPRMGDDISESDARQLLDVLDRYDQKETLELLLQHSARARAIHQKGANPSSMEDR